MRAGWWCEGLLGVGAGGHFRALTGWAHASAGCGSRGVCAALRAQGRTHGVGAGVCSDSLQVYTVDIQITNLVVERKIFAKQKQDRLA